MLEITNLPLVQIIILIFVVSIAGFFRGLVGFGSGMIMAGPLAIILGPNIAVAIIILLEIGISAPLMAQSRAMVNWKLVKQLIIGAIITAPIGVYFLLMLSPRLSGIVISFLVIIAAIAIIVGYQRQSANTSFKNILAGSASGFSCGIAGISGPPVVLYLLSGKHKALEVRASLIYYFVLIDIYVTASMLIAGSIGIQAFIYAIVLLPVMWFTAKIGSNKITSTKPLTYKVFALWIIIIANLISLIFILIKL